MVRAGVVGSTGLVGEGLIRILCRHPEVRLAVLTSRHAAGKDIAAVLPSLRGVVSMELVEPSVDSLAAGCDVVFLAMKTAESMKLVPELVSRGVRCIDIGGEFRFRDPAVYEQWYGSRHEAPEDTARSVWGLPELNREKIKAADIVGNPGCYPTGAVLGLLPLLRDEVKNLIHTDGIIVDAYSGLSGAGRQYRPSPENTFLGCYENLRAYAVGTHRHTPEIEQVLSGLTGEGVTVTFVPHLAPVDRGILSTIYVRPAEKVKAEALVGGLREALEAFAGPEPFVRACAKPGDVRTANVRATNFCDVGAAFIERSCQVVIVTAIDNTVKGAGGQAVQNMNIMFGLDETAGLDRPGM